MPVDMRITLRLPLAVHTALTREARETGASLNALIVDKLNASAGSPYRGGAEASVTDRVDILESRLADLANEVEALKRPKAKG